MSYSVHILGKLVHKGELVTRSETFSFRNFAIEVAPTDGANRQNFISFQLSNDRMQQLDDFQEGQEILVDAELAGRLWTNPRGEQICFNTFDAWRIRPASEAFNAAPPSPAYQHGQQPSPAYQQGAQQMPSAQGAQPVAQPAAAQPGNRSDLPF